MSEIWIIRHAEALPDGNDDTRELSAHGRWQANGLGRFLRQLALPPPEIFWHSELLRARQTTELLLETAGWQSVAEERSYLRPEDNPVALADQIAKMKQPIAIVAHNPFLTRLASWLVTGDAEAEAFQMEPATCLCLKHQIHLGGANGPFRRYTVSWMIPPHLIRESD